MVGEGMAQDRANSDAGAPQSQAKVVVFTAPAFEALVVTVDPFVVFPPDADVVAKESRLGGVFDRFVEPPLTSQLGEPPFFLGRAEAHQVHAPDIGGADVLGGLFIEPQASAGHDGILAPMFQMDFYVVRGQHAVAVEEEKVGGGAGIYAFVTASR